MTLKSIGFTILGSVVMSAGSVMAQAPAASSASIAVKMSAFEMPAEYNCPLFSNSPYTDMLTSLDKMQENLNTIFPECENKANNQKLNETSNSLHKKVIEAQLFQKNGQTYKLNQSASTIVDLTRSLQQSLVTMSATQTKVCYKNEGQFRNVIFSINDTFQSLAPLILDLASQTPGLGQTLGPALKIFAGADAISKGLSLIEQIAKDSVQFDMSDKDNRINTVKNTCQFMKLYNRLSYLRLSRIGQVQSIHSKFQTEIADMNQKVGTIKAAEASRNRTRAAGAPQFVSRGESMRVSTDDSLVLFEKLKVSTPQQQSIIQKALADFDQAKAEDNFPEITQCQIVKSLLKSTGTKNFINELQQFAVAVRNTNDVMSAMDVIRAYELDLNAAITESNRNLCKQLGQDWLRKIDQLFIMSRQMIAHYEIELIELNGEAYVIKQRKLAKDAEKLKSVESDYRNLKTMLTYAAFESSEVEKRAKGMHKYLFAGPDHVTSECASKDKDNECNLGKKFLGVIKAYGQEIYNQGPVFELIRNNEKYFDDSYTKMERSMVYIQRFEDQFLPANIKAMANTINPKIFEQYFIVREKHAFALDHLTSKYLVKGTAQYSNICNNGKLVVNEYLKATNHMMSTYGMCEMIKNVLHEPEVSKDLKAYCQPKSDTIDSKLNQLRFRLAGQYDDSSKKSELQVVYFNRSPKAFIDQLLIRMEELGCYSN